MKFDKIEITENFINKVEGIIVNYCNDGMDEPYFYYELETLDEKTNDQEMGIIVQDGGLVIEPPIKTDTTPSPNSTAKMNFVLYDQELITILQSFMNEAGLHTTQPFLPEVSLYWAINDMRHYKQKTQDLYEPFDMLLKFTEDIFGNMYSTMDNLIENGNISFDMLWYHFDKTDALYTFDYHDEPICVRYDCFSYYENYKGEFTSFDVSCKGTQVYNGELALTDCDYEIKKFTGIKKIANLKIKKVTDEQKAVFTEYGNEMVKYLSGFHHKFMNGKIVVKLGDTVIKQEKKERVMIDSVGSKMHGNITPFFDISGSHDVIDEEHCTIIPFIPVYNLGIDKTWGITHIKNISEFEYEGGAFDCLVLDPVKKRLIKALINNRTLEYKDFISDKGNNTIFLLSGTPGVGKSLTAEATAEYLKLPLYRINVGDLGTNSEHMESILSRIFALTDRWNAIILIDEVDIFIEERNDYNIVHNAMVSTFMKVLDYNNSIIFLTTNRLKSIDSAVKSRINLLLNYTDLCRKDRSNVWTGLLKQWSINLSVGTIQELSEYKINGREIRNFIKTIMSIHRDDDEDVSDKSVLDTMKLLYKTTNEFDNHLQSSLYH